MSNTTHAKLPLMLRQLNLPGMASLWADLSQQSDLEGWGCARFLEILCEHELQGRESRRFAKHFKEANLPKGKTFSTYDFDHCPMLNKTQMISMAKGGSWLKNGENILVFGPSGVGKTHLVAAIGTQLIEQGHRVMFSSTTGLLQKLQAARKSYSLPSAIEKLDKYDVLILDDLGYVQKDHDETGVLFELISERYERRSMIITCNQPFGEWDTIFKDKTMAVAAIDRLVHHAIILQMNNESYRKAAAISRSKRTILSKDESKGGGL
jgi:DNA replication protein DnaC